MSGEREESWAPNPEWPPDVQRFITGLRMHMLTLTPQEQRRVMADMALWLMDPSPAQEVGE